HVVSQRVRRDHESPRRPVVVPPSLVGLRTEDIWKRREAEVAPRSPVLLREVHVLVTRDDRVVFDIGSDVEFHEPAADLFELRPGGERREGWAVDYNDERRAQAVECPPFPDALMVPDRVTEIVVASPHVEDLVLVEHADEHLFPGGGG